MSVDYTTILGLAAGALTTTSFLPQLVKTWRTKSTKDVSLAMFIILGLGLFLWVLYGLSISSLPVILTNLVTLVLVFIIIILKIRYAK